MKDLEPGTLVWVGNHSHPEFTDAFRFCCRHTAQMAIRRSPRELIERPAGMVKRILFARLDRRPLPLTMQSGIRDRYADAQWLALNSTLCDGEPRTGSPWPNSRQARFSRWHEVLPNWLEPCGNSPPVEQSAGATLVICDRYELAEPYLEFAASLDCPVVWQRGFNAATCRQFSHVIWDDSVATPTTPEVWRQRLGTAANVKHSWLAIQPQVTEIAAAVAGGVGQVLTKPVSLPSLLAGTHWPTADS